MGLLNVYNTLENEHTVIKANGRLHNILPEIDFSRSLVLKAGKRLDGNYEVQPDDVLFIREVPAAVTTAVLVAVTAATIAVGVAVGSAIYAKVKSDQAKAEMEKAQRDAQNLAQQVQQLPFIRGAKNRKALGESVQFIMGDVYNTPYNLTDGFYSIDGADGVNSYYNAVFSCGYGPQKITKLYLGNEIIAQNDNGINGQQDFDSTSLYYDQNNSNKVEVRQADDAITLTNCNQKVSATYSGAELKHDFGQDAVPVIVQAAENAMSIQVCIQFSCLRQYNSEEETWQAQSATVRPYWSNDGGANWHEFTFSGSTNNVFTKNSNKNIRFVATKNFTAAESLGKNISIKVEKTSVKPESGTQEDCCLLWYQTFQYDADKSTSLGLVACTPVEPELFNKTTRVAYRVVATESTQNMLDELHAQSLGYARTWDGTEWSDTKEPTRNPASWLLEVLTSPVHAPSQFELSELDLDSFGALYDYCVTNSFYCDTVISASEKKLAICEKILSLCNASLIRNQEGLLEICIDKLETNPVALLNTENIVSFSFSKSLQKKTDGTKVTYTNRESWSVDTFYSMLDGGSYDYANDTVDTLALDYVTTYEHAYKMAQRKLRQRQLQPREVRAEVGSEGDWYPLYSTVLLQLPQLLQGLNSSVIKSIEYDLAGRISQITISDLVEFQEDKRYGIIIQATNSYGYKLYSTEVEYTPVDENDENTYGFTRTLTFTDPLDLGQNIIVPEIGNHLSFGLLDDYGRFSKITNTMKIYGIEPNGSDGYTLILRDYNEDVYSYGGTIPAYKSNITRPQAPNTPVTTDDISRLRQSMNVLQEDLINAYQMLEMPLVCSADVTSVIIETDTNGQTVVTQRVTSQITCRQGSEDRHFVIGEIQVPDGWSYEITDGAVVFTIPAGITVHSGQFKIPVVYTPVIAYDEYADENGNLYVDENDNQYVSQVLASQTYTQEIWFSYFGMNDGVYLGIISQLDDLPSISAINDYFVWGGEVTESDLSMEGSFLPGRVYHYIGPNKAWKWEPDEDIGHNTLVLGDIMSVANTDLEHNNSLAYEYLDHLTSNSIFTDLLIANTAFIDNLFAQHITIKNNGWIASEGYTEGSRGFRISSDGLIEAYEGRFAGGLGKDQIKDLSYRDWLPFVSGMVAIYISTVFPTGSAYLESREMVALGFVMTHSITYAQGGKMHTRIEQEYTPIYAASGMVIYYDTESVEDFLRVTVTHGFKIGSVPAPKYQSDNPELVFHYLEF